MYFLYFSEKYKIVHEQDINKHNFTEKSGHPGSISECLGVRLDILCVHCATFLQCVVVIHVCMFMYRRRH